VEKKAAQKQISTIKKNVASVFLIHYSCESFYDKPDGFSSRIAAIAIKNYYSDQSFSFSIAETAEKMSINRNEVEANFDKIELKMLEDLFNFLSMNRSNYFVHWNMTSSQYGFYALYHRIEKLGGRSIKLNENRLFDLAEILKSVHGDKYVSNPRLDKLTDLNELNKRDFLTGAEEAKAFESEQFDRLQMSTLRKISCISKILELQIAGKLKTEASENKVEQWTNQNWFIYLAIIGGLASIVGLIWTFIAPIFSKTN
jgi:hypothetical protein